MDNISNNEEKGLHDLIRIFSFQIVQDKPQEIKTEKVMTNFALSGI